MTDNDPVDELLMRWLALRNQGQDIGPEELCRDRPELLAELRRRIETALLHEHVAKSQGDAPTLPLPLLVQSVPHRTPGDSGDSRKKPPAPLPRVPGYEVIRLLRPGGMGVVYKARQLKPERIVALKMLLPQSMSESGDVNRFKAEAEAIAQLQHPNIVQIFEVGELEGQPYFSLEYCDRGSLEQSLNGTPLSAKAAAQLAETVARAVQFAHDHRIIHRDLKPGNILLRKRKDEADRTEVAPTPAAETKQNSDVSVHLSECELKITDFGLAKRLDLSLKMTTPNAIMGTPSYMSPEQARGDTDAIGPATDIYSTGAILYECLTGRPPFKAANYWDTIAQVLHDEPAPPGRLVTGVPHDLETICLKCLQKEQKKRYACARDLADDLHRFLTGDSIRARPVGAGEKLIKWVRRRPAIAGLLAALLAVTALAIGLILWSYGVVVSQRDDLKFEKDRADQQADEAKRLAKIAEDTAKVALDAKEFAEKKSKELEEALITAKFLALKADTALHAIELKLTQDAYRQGNVDLALEKLNGCTRDLCGWEHDYLTGLCHQRMQTWKGQQASILCVATSRDEKYFASGGQDKTVKVWHADSARGTFTLKGHTGAVVAIAFSPDGKFLASASMDQSVRVWNVSTKHLVHILAGHTAPVRSVAFSPNGQRLLTGSEDRTLRVWHFATGDCLLGKQHGSEVNAVAFAPNNKQLLSGGTDGVVKIWDAVTGVERLALPATAGTAHAAAFGLTDKQVFVAYADGTVRMWDATTRQERQVYRGHSGAVHSLATSQDGRWLFTAGEDQTVRVWSVASAELHVTLQGHAKSVTGVVCSADGSRLVTGGRDDTLRLWNISPHEEQFTLGEATRLAGAVAFSRDGQLVAVAAKDRTIKLWHVATAKHLCTLAGHEGAVQSMAFSPHGQLLASGSADKTVRIWDVIDGKEIHCLVGHGQTVLGVAFSPDGKHVISAGKDKEVRVWDVAAGMAKHVLCGHGLQATCVACGAASNLMVTGGWDHAAILWDLNKGSKVHVFKAHPQGINCVAVSTDNKLIASAYRDRNIQIWDTVHKKALLTCNRHAREVLSVAFHPSGKRIASGCIDGSIKIWDTWTGQDLLTLQGHAGGVFHVAFSGDGKRLLSAGRDEVIKIWEGPRN